MHMYEIRILSRHPSHKVLRRKLPKLTIPSVVRLGSLTKVDYHCVEINSINSVKISSDKKLMKQKFDEAKVETAPWTFGDTVKEVSSNLEKLRISYPIMAKSRNGSRGRGNYLIKNTTQLKSWAQGKDLSRYIFEKYFNYSLEYRLHITRNGSFYTCRKALKRNRDTSKDFQRHIDNTVWFLEANEQFRKPNSWKDIVSNCVSALKAIGADVLSFDVRVQGEADSDGSKRKYQKFILIESNSASSMNSDGDVSVCAQKYLEMLPKLIMQKGEVKK